MKASALIISVVTAAGDRLRVLGAEPTARPTAGGRRR
jgi:hypothetical protein